MSSKSHAWITKTFLMQLKIKSAIFLIWPTVFNFSKKVEKIKKIEISKQGEKS